jgi:hypothetical protein
MRANIRWAAAIALFASLWSPAAFAQTAQPAPERCASALAQHLQLDVSNPGPGDSLLAGGVVIDGVAFDRLAQAGTGIDRVSLFLDERDTGGTHLADATLNQPNPVHPTGQFDMAGFTALIDLPDQTGQHTLDVHAHSAITGQEMIVTIPFVLGDDSISGLSCTATVQGEPQPVTPTGAEAAAAANAIAPGALPDLHLELSNPMSNALVPVGDYDVQLVAFDRSALAGTGVDRVSVFLGQQDQGGELLGSIANDPSFGPRELRLRLSVPDRPGGHDLVAYAHTPDGRIAVVDIPITITR